MTLGAALVKICGINSIAAFDAVVDAQSDYLGFVFFNRSPRFVTPAQAAALGRRHRGGPQRVGLFVEPDDNAIQAALDAVRLDVLQIYGSVARCQAHRQRFGLPVWRAAGVSIKAELPEAAEGLDGFVIEAKPPQGATRPGGNGSAMDWGLLAGWNAPAFWLLGGGLNADNVVPAILATGTPAVDVSSGVETAPGEKSTTLIREFIARVRSVAV
jgi:phosphoribosylanthranilate isomerase